MRNVLAPAVLWVATSTAAVLGLMVGGGLIASWAHRRTMARLDARDQLAAHVVHIRRGCDT